MMRITTGASLSFSCSTYCDMNSRSAIILVPHTESVNQQYDLDEKRSKHNGRATSATNLPPAFTTEQVLWWPWAPPLSLYARLAFFQALYRIPGWVPPFLKGMQPINALFGGHYPCLLF